MFSLLTVQWSARLLRGRGFVSSKKFVTAKKVEYLVEKVFEQDRPEKVGFDCRCKKAECSVTKVF